MSTNIASIVILRRGTYQAQVFKSIEAAAGHALDIMLKRPKDWECIHAIRDHENNVVWRYEGGAGLAMARLYKIIYKGEPKERNYEQDQE